MSEALKERKWLVLFICAFTCGAFLLQFTFRSIDNNRLTSWNWVFAGIGAAWVFVPAILAGALIFYLLLKAPVTAQRPALFLLFLSFALSALFWDIPEVIVDSARYFTQAKHLERYGISYFLSQWGRDIHAWTDLPLMPFLYGIIFQYAGESRAVIQLFNSLAFSVTVLSVYLIGKNLWDEDTGFSAAVLMLGIPYLFSQTPLMLVDVGTMLFLTLAVLLCLSAMDRGGLWTAAAAGAAWCAWLSKYSAWLMLTVLAPVFLVKVLTETAQGIRGADSGAGKKVVRGLVTGAMAAALAAIVYLSYSDVMSAQIAFLREYQAPGLRRWGESFASTFLYQVHPFITFAAVVSLYQAVRKRDLKYLIISWMIILIVALQIKRSRYVLIAFPMLVLMASYGLQRIRSSGLRRLVVSCIISSSLVVALGAYVPLLQRMSSANMKHAGEFLSASDADAVEVLTAQMPGMPVNTAVAVPVLDLFTSVPVIYRDKENMSVSPGDVTTSPLRFTWEFQNPSYYTEMTEQKQQRTALAVITNIDMKTLPPAVMERLRGYEAAAVFDASTDLFRYSPVVTVYRQVNHE